MDITPFLPAIAEKSILALVLIFGIVALWRSFQAQAAKRDAERAETQKMMFDMHERSLVAQNTGSQSTSQLAVAIDKWRETSATQHDALMQEVRRNGKQSVNGKVPKTATA
ncbi:hypothetical protein [Fibrella forsythiae]|uniref:Uncharacterized protein n=1 Tax=Fibrella forsythiae TaxID=2817061 RepID=A0ABS3JBW3_9BACT|nr:hypothetical protein [Fibrella forsythiae]MBO0946951.1 hypothetical protein [Fibrella forsythiae]